MPEKSTRSAAQYLPKKITWPSLCKAAEGCRGCDLYKLGTQTVFGQGPLTASLILVGEQPGDEEDKQGLPFVGPAGKLLDRALAEAGIPKKEVYVTNAVKHFKFTIRGKKRLHQSPSPREAAACKPWLLAEIELIKPEVVLCLGATAAKSLLGAKFALTKHRGEWQPGPHDAKVMATYHPSAALRAPDHDARKALYDAIVEDLTTARGLLHPGSAGLPARDFPSAHP
jgi:uracil-DNA glycosylase